MRLRGLLALGVLVRVLVRVPAKPLLAGLRTGPQPPTLTLLYQSLFRCGAGELFLVLFVRALGALFRGRVETVLRRNVRGEMSSASSPFGDVRFGDVVWRAAW